MAAKKNKVLKVVSKNGPIETPEGEFKINLYCGVQKSEGYINIHDMDVEGVDYVIDFKSYPFPIEDGVVDEVLCSGYLPFLDGMERFQLLDECWRIMKQGARLIISAAARGSNGSYSNPFYKFPPVSEDFFYYANKDWRESSGYGHYPISCDFDWGYGFSIDDEIKSRNDEFQRLGVKFLRNTAHELVITMTKK